MTLTLERPVLWDAIEKEVPEGWAVTAVSAVNMVNAGHGDRVLEDPEGSVHTAQTIVYKLALTEFLTPRGVVSTEV
jgi:hypothetical protein